MTTPSKLLGTYESPRFHVGAVVSCARRGDMVILGVSEAPIPWPIGRPPGRGRGRTSLVLYRDLVKAVRRESAQAIAYWWGVSTLTVWGWRKALGVGQYTEGTRGLKSEVHTPILDAARELALPTLSSPERREKIAASKRGKPRPMHVIEAVRAAHLGKPHSEDAKRKMSEAHRRRGTMPPAAGGAWTAEEDGAVRTMAPKDAAEATGRTLRAVYSRRLVLGLPDGRAVRKAPHQ